MIFVYVEIVTAVFATILRVVRVWEGACPHLSFDAFLRLYCQDRVDLIRQGGSVASYSAV